MNLVLIASKDQINKQRIANNVTMIKNISQSKEKRIPYVEVNKQ